MKARIPSTTLCAALASLSLLTLGADAKPGKGKGNGKGGPPGHAQKGNPGKGNSGKGKGGPPAHAGGGKARPSGAPAARELERRVEREWNDEFRRRARFVDRDRTRVIDYFGEYRSRDHGLPPGLAKNLRRGKPLPPGWQKKLNPGVVIVDDWWDRFVPLPYSRFPGIDPIANTGLYMYGDRVYRVYEPRREIVDVIVVPTIHIDL